MVIFQYNVYIFGIHLWTMFYPKTCYNEPCYKEVEVYFVDYHNVHKRFQMDTLQVQSRIFQLYASGTLIFSKGTISSIPYD